MLNKKRLYLYLFLAASVFLAFLFFIQKNESKPKPKPTDTMQDGNSIVEASEIANNDKDFYAISLKNNETNLTIKNNYFKNLRKLFMAKDAHIEDMDKAMTALLMDKKTNRTDKINGLWSILKKIGFTSEKSEYLLDSLATLLPIELTDELIATYANTDISHKMKMKMVEMLSNNLFITNPEVQDEETLQFITEKAQDIQVFIKDKVLSDSSAEIASEGLHAYAAISSSEDIQELMISIEEGVYNTDISKDLIRDVLTETAFGTAKSQADMLPEMLNDMDNNPNIDTKEKEAFNQMLIEGLNAGVLTEGSQKELMDYMQRNEPKLQLHNDESVAKVSDYYNWAKASTKIKNNETSLVNIALENDNPLKVSSVLLYGDAQTIQKIKESPNVDNMYVRLEASLEDNSINHERKTIISDAIRVLKEDTPNVNK